MEHIQEENYEQPIQQTESLEVSQAEQTAQPTQTTNSPQQENFRNLRTAKERLEQENRELQQRLKSFETAQQPQYDSDDYVPRSYVDAQLQVQRKQLEQLTTEYRLKTQYQDFDKVVNNETIEILKEKNPSMAHALGQIQDEYAKASGAYEAIKALGIYQEDNYQQERARAEKNAASPRPAHTVGTRRNDSPLSYANAFAEGSKEHLDALYKELIQSRKNF